jgi:hypothetical protein
MMEATRITVRVPLTVRRRPGRKTVVVAVRDGGETAFPTRADPALVKALARAFRYQKLLDEGGTPRSAKWRQRRRSSDTLARCCD